ncbi:MAG: selenocysteine-specific translation elongation factor [Candidatus Limnocylindrales bacterium]
MTVVVGTAGHIDHGKTALLRALTGIDADRLPEERRRGMTIDVGYAWLTLPDGEALDFVDVPGHDRLVGNMLVGAGEIDAAMLVVAADDGPRAQTLEHLELLDALGIREGLAVVTKLELLEPDDPRRTGRLAEVAALLAGSSLAGTPVLGVSAVSGEGLDELRAALVELSRRVLARPWAPAGRTEGGMRLAIDRVFTARGRGVVITGTLRGGRLERGETVRLLTAGHAAAVARVRELQVHGHPVDVVAGSGRVALNLAGMERAALARGMVATTSRAVVASERLLVALRETPAARRLRDGAEVRLHVGTEEVLGNVRLVAGRPLEPPGAGPGPRMPAPAPERLGLLRLSRPIAVALDDRFVLRWPSPAATAAGGRVLDPLPPVRLARRRLDGTALAPLAIDGSSVEARFAALLGVHGALREPEAAAYAAALGSPGAIGVRAGRLLLDPSLVAALEREASEAVTAHQAAEPLAAGLPLARLRPLLVRSLRRAAAILPDEAAPAVDTLLERLVDAGRLARSGDLLCDPTRRADVPPALASAMERLEASLASSTPPPLAQAARAADCPPEGVRLLEANRRIVRVEPDLAYAAEAYARLESLALAMAAQGPLTPAAFRDASGTSRKYALAILEEMDARGLLRRGPDGHRLGPRV